MGIRGKVAYSPTRREQIGRKIDFDLPADHKPHTDKYFLRSNDIIKKERINPRVVYQVFIRKGPGTVNGINEAISAIMKYSPKLAEHDGKIYALCDGDQYEPKETLMFIEGPVQDLMELETMYLSILSERTNKANNAPDPDLEKITNTVSEIVDVLEKSKCGPRPVSYFGARHFGYEWDARISKAAYDGGATSASTDVGAQTFGQKGVGTTPHALLITFASKYGIENYAAEAMKAFDKHVDPKVPRIFLGDTFNKEITDTLKVARALGDRFDGPRFDTNGAVIAEGGVPVDNRKYWTGKGVTIEGVYNATKAYRANGFSFYNKLTSGFSNPRKVAEFVKAEEKYNTQLFDFIGAGFADNRYTATSDIMGYYNSDGKFVELHKIGRPIRLNKRLRRIDLDDY